MKGEILLIQNDKSGQQNENSNRLVIGLGLKIGFWARVIEFLEPGQFRKKKRIKIKNEGLFFEDYSKEDKKSKENENKDYISNCPRVL